MTYYDKSLDIGARLPVNAYKYGMDVPGQIKAAFNRPFGGVAERMRDKAIIEFSKNIYNEMSKTEHYCINKNIDNNVLENLPDFDLEELVISYIQIKHGYYLLSNSIAKNSTTIKVECEFRSRDRTKPGRAVVQVKGPKSKELDATDYIQYAEKGYQVFLYAPKILHPEVLKENLIIVTGDDLLRFYQDYKAILPESITQWECLFGL